MSRPRANGRKLTADARSAVVDRTEAIFRTEVDAIPRRSLRQGKLTRRGPEMPNHSLTLKSTGDFFEGPRNLIHRDQAKTNQVLGSSLNRQTTASGVAPFTETGAKLGPQR